jgi:hypothetical protein
MGINQHAVDKTALFLGGRDSIQTLNASKVQQITYPPGLRSAANLRDISSKLTRLSRMMRSMGIDVVPINKHGTQHYSTKAIQSVEIARQCLPGSGSDNGTYGLRYYPDGQRDAYWHVYWEAQTKGRAKALDGAQEHTEPEFIADDNTRAMVIALRTAVKQMLEAGSEGEPDDD